MIVGFDLDGVIFKPVLPLYGMVKRTNLDFLIYRLKKINFVKNYFYKSIKINQPLLKILKQLIKRHEIIIISGHSDRCVEDVKNCLLKNRVPFNKIYLRFDGEEYFNFKVEKVIETGCNFYVEDRLGIVKLLRQRLNGACRIIHYKNSSSIKELESLLTS
jgi:uncharacterized HAD superfamily protein